MNGDDFSIFLLVWEIGFKKKITAISPFCLCQKTFDGFCLYIRVYFFETMIPGFSIQTFLEAFRIFFDVFFPEHVFPFRMEKLPFRMEISPFKHFRSVSNLFLKFVFFVPEHFLHSEWRFFQSNFFRRVSNLFFEMCLFFFQNIFSIQNGKMSLLNGDFSTQTFSEAFRTFF